MPAPKSLRPLLERIMDRVEKTETCWMWTGTINNGGYGYLGHVAIHRAMWEFTFGPIPAGLFVCHRCDVRHCCNPRHLFLGTQRDNVHDCIKKGRNTAPPIAKKGCHIKVSDTQVIEIKQRFASGEKQADIAAAFGVTQPLISLIGRGLHRA